MQLTHLLTDEQKAIRKAVREFYEQRDYAGQGAS